MSALTDIVVIAIVIGVAHELFKSGKIDQIFQQLQAAIPTPAATPAPTPVPEAAPSPAPEAAPAEGGGGEATPTEGGGATPAPAAAGGCDCSCMPMDSDPSRFKIETAAGVDCYNNIYPASMAECETALKEVCAKRGGGGGSTPAATESGGSGDSGGGGDDKAAEGGGDSGGGGGEDSGGGDKESNYARSCLDYTPMNWG